MSETDPDTESQTTGGSPWFEETVERAFTCSLCGFATTYDVKLLRGEVQSVCVNCGEWTTQSADADVLAEAAQEAAEALAGEILTERQALAYLLREVIGADRETTATVMDSTPSNVDNLQRRGAEKITAAAELVGKLDVLQLDDDVGATKDSGAAEGGDAADDEAADVADETAFRE